MIIYELLGVGIIFAALGLDIRISTRSRYSYHTIQNFGGENFGEMAHSKDWRIKFWQMSKIPYNTKFWREEILVKWLMAKTGG